MAQITLLSNQTRAAQRPPLMVNTASAGVLAKLLPVAKKPVQKSFDSGARRPEGPPQPPAAGASPAPVKPESNPPVSPAPSTKPQPARTNSTPGAGQKTPAAFQPPRAPSLHAPGTGAAGPSLPAQSPQKPGTNGKSSSQPAGNGTGKNGFTHHSQLFRPENYPPARSTRTVDPRDRFRPRPSQPAQPQPEVPHTPRNGLPPAVHNNRPAGVESPRPVQPVHQQSDPQEKLRRLFQEHNDLPAQSAVLGISRDSFPVVLDLNDPAPGSVVLIGDERSVHLDFLRGLVDSIAMRNTPRSVQILIVSVDPHSWKEWIAARGYNRFCLSIEGADQVDALREWILRLGDWTEQRRLGQRSGPPVLLIMDTLSFLPHLTYDVRLNFEWMAKEGPPAQIWPVATISTELAQLLNGRRMLRAFQTRILGYAKDPSFYVQLAGLSEQESAGFIQPGRFVVRLGETWLEFGLP